MLPCWAWLAARLILVILIRQNNKLQNVGNAMNMATSHKIFCVQSYNYYAQSYFTVFWNTLVNDTNG